ncbi:MAG TPA: 30S ribosome-binding factor RbfA [Clostridiales bacterium]|nr:30S ribosome-binding factor RbfA [Clostridiales bacterium]
MDPARLERLRTAIKEEVSDILRSFKDPRLGFVSVTDVELSRDARVAKVFVSVLGSKKDKEDSLQALRSGTGFVRSELGRRIRLRHTPEVVFRLDDSIERGTRIQTILGQLGSRESGLRKPAGGPEAPSGDDGEDVR